MYIFDQLKGLVREDGPGEGDGIDAESVTSGQLRSPFNNEGSLNDRQPQVLLSNIILVLERSKQNWKGKKWFSE